MYLLAISNAVPDQSFTQPQCWQFLNNEETLAGLSDRSASILQKVLTGDAGIDKRHFALDQPEMLFSRGASFLNQSFEQEAPKLARAALTPALLSAGIDAKELDALFICTCTGYLCPGISSYVAEQLEMPSNTFLHDTVGLGCGAAIPTLRAASNFIAAHPDAAVGVIAVEVCSAAFFMDNDPGVLISLCLFGDGASGSVWVGPSHPSFQDSLPRVDNFNTFHVPRQRELLRFQNEGGKLRNKLHRSVPQAAADAVSHLFDQALAEGGPTPEIVSHGGGRDVLDALSERFPAQDFSIARGVLRDFGNMSSPSVLFALERTLARDGQSADLNYWLTSFGAGFAAHSCRLTR